MNLYSKLFRNFGKLSSEWLDDEVAMELEEKLQSTTNKDFIRWNGVLDKIATVHPGSMTVRDGKLHIESSKDLLDESSQQELASLLKQLCPWRKGPYYVHGIHLDTEWRSDFKWERVAPHISPLKYRTVLDVGCGNGYHCFRMAEDGAQAVVGVDPFILSVMQFRAVHLLSTQQRVCILPLSVDDVPQKQWFDTVFSMGLLYHRKSPIDHLFQLKGFLRPGGEMVLETLVIEGENGQVLVPKNRYAMMRNVWFVPSIESLRSWIERVGFVDVRLVDVNQTTFEEQRRTEWMSFDSLSDFLDPLDANLTQEGYPAPRRAVFVATKPQ